MADKEYLKRFHDELMAKGQYVEAGWIGLRMAAIAPDAGKAQLEEMRMAFFAGAQHIFHGVMYTLDEDAEPTEADLIRMSKIDEELKKFLTAFKLKHGLS